MIYLFYIIGIIIFIAIIIASIYSVNHNVELLLKVLRVISGFTLIILTCNIFINTFVANRDVYEKNAKNTLEIVNRNFLNIYKLFSESLPYSFDLYVETHPDIDFSKQSNKRNHHQLDDHYLVTAKETTICIFLIQAMEDFLTIGMYDKTGPEVWISIFLGWLHSNKLIVFWNKMKDSYSIDTQYFVNDMIKKVDILKKQREQNKPVDYIAVAKSVIYKFRE